MKIISATGLNLNLYPESLKALPILAKKFPRIIITTNQKGVGKGLMTDD